MTSRPSTQCNDPGNECLVSKCLVSSGCGAACLHAVEYSSPVSKITLSSDLKQPQLIAWLSNPALACVAVAKPVDMTAFDELLHGSALAMSRSHFASKPDNVRSMHLISAPPTAFGVLATGITGFLVMIEWVSVLF